MSYTVYEAHRHDDPDLPIIFHLDECVYRKEDFRLHWHEALELLYFIEGESIVTSGVEQIPAKPGDIVVINSNNLHAIRSVTAKSLYYCLIVDKSFSDSFGLNVAETSLLGLIDNSISRDYYDTIIEEMLSKKPYYKAKVKSAIIELLVHFFRYFTVATDIVACKANARKLEMVKSAISYIKLNYEEKCSIEEICAYIGFSKYYFCHTFKEITGETVVDYINFTRCSCARKLLCAGKHTVGEVAELSGIRNLSYFSKTYKKYMGVLPSQESPTSISI